MMFIKEKSQLFLDLLWGMTEKELKARYKHTVFGFLWVVVNPVLQMLVIGFVFKLFIKDPLPNYYLYLFSGLLTWNFFSLSLTKSTPSIVNERSLIKKAKFPHSVIPLSIIFSNLVNLLIAFFMLIILTAYNKLFSLAGIPYFILAIILLVSFTVGFSLFSAALNVRFRDVNFFVQALLMVWFYATPIVYSISVVPYDLMWLWRINPMTSIMQLFQYVFASAPPPGVGMLAINGSINLLFLVLGIFIFKKESKNFDDWV
ncbi:MAG: ABC transporter permease [Patescibacteria group bacterium]